MNWQEHIAQAERLLKEAAENPDAPPEERLVWATSAMAHAMLAEAKRVVK